MDQLKRWREERAIRQSLRLLKDFRDPDDPLPSAGRRLHSLEPATRLGRRAAKAAGKRKFKLWPDPPRVSPVHPEWDDPTGDRFKKSMYKSMGVHFMIIPSLLLLSSIDLTKETRTLPGSGSFRMIPIELVGAGAQKDQTPRPPTAPKTNPVKPPPEKPKEVEKPKPKPPAEKPPVKPAVKPAVKPVDKPTPKPAENSVIPVPTPDKKVGSRDGTAERRSSTAADNGDNSDDDAEPVTDPLAKEGPLVTAVGPVPGSTTGIGFEGDGLPSNSYYLEIIRGKIAQSWQVPEGLVSKGRRITAMVRFRIGRDGAIQETIIEEPSGFGFFDQAAVRAVSQVRKFPPLPQDFGGGHLIVHFQFTFVGR